MGPAFGPYRAVPGELRVDDAPLPVWEIEETGRRADYQAFHDLVRAIVRGGELVVIRYELSHYGAKEWHHWLDCVGERAMVELSRLNGVEPEREVPYLLGPKPALRMIGSLAPAPVAKVFESRPVMTDFRGYAHLWVDDEPDPAGFDQYRAEFVVLGRGVADMHRNGFIHGDLHGGNIFVDVTTETVTAIDLSTSMFVCPPAAPVLCATDIAPLMEPMIPSVWRAFREGYSATWPGGRAVVDLIEQGDRTGWAAAIASGDLTTAGRLLDDALRLVDADDAEAKMMLLMQSVRCLLSAGRFEPAVERAREAIALAEEQGLPDSLIRYTEFNLAVALSMSGDKLAALRLLNEILRSPDINDELRSLAIKVTGEILDGG